MFAPPDDVWYLIIRQLSWADFKALRSCCKAYRYLLEYYATFWRERYARDFSSTPIFDPRTVIVSHLATRSVPKALKYGWECYLTRYLANKDNLAALQQMYFTAFLPMLFEAVNGDFLVWFLGHFDITKFPNTHNGSSLYDRMENAIIYVFNNYPDIIGKERLDILCEVISAKLSTVYTSVRSLFLMRNRIEQYVTVDDVDIDILPHSIKIANHLIMKHDMTDALSKYLMTEHSGYYYFLAHHYNATKCLALLIDRQKMSVAGLITAGSKYILAQNRTAEEIIPHILALKFTDDELYHGINSKLMKLDTLSPDLIMKRFQVLYLLVLRLNNLGEKRRNSLMVRCPENPFTLLEDRDNYRMFSDLTIKYLTALSRIPVSGDAVALPDRLTVQKHAPEQPTKTKQVRLYGRCDRERSHYHLSDIWLDRYYYFQLIASVEPPFEWLFCNDVEKEWVTIIGNDVVTKREFVVCLQRNNPRSFLLIPPGFTATLPARHHIIVIRVGMTDPVTVKKIYV